MRNGRSPQRGRGVLSKENDRPIKNANFAEVRGTERNDVRQQDMTKPTNAGRWNEVIM